MKLRYLFVILALLVITPSVLLFFLLYNKGGGSLYVTEAIIFVTIIFIFYFYRKVLKPLDSIAGGMDLLSAQDFSSRLSPVGQAEADRIVVLFNKLMERVKEERMNRIEQNYFLSLLIEESPMGVVLLDYNDCITLLNPAAKQFMAIDEGCVGSSIHSLDSHLAREILKIEQGDKKTIRLDGTAIYRCSRLSFMNGGFCRPFIIIEPLTDEIFRAEKSAYGKVIRMIAHEVNNSVAGVTSALATISEVLATTTEATMEKDIADIRDVLKVCEERGYNMSRFIADFAGVVKIPELVLHEVHINECVLPCICLMKHKCREQNITLRTMLTEEPVIVNADTTLFEQVVLNIMKNSIESIGKGGEIIVETFASPARILITDNGHGISADDSSRIFSPFFSTKANGQGLGLMFVREILTKHGCLFSLATASDGFTRFEIIFR